MNIKVSSSEGEGLYVNSFHHSGKAIACLHNDKQFDDITTRMFWSDIFYNQYRLFIDEYTNDVRMTDLEAIWRMNIINPDTQNVIKACIPHGTNEPCYEFRDNTRQFFALLGTPNATGIVRMLREYPGAFGRKTIDTIRVFPNGKWFYMCLSLIAAPFSPRKRSRVISRAKERRMAKRSSLSGKGSQDSNLI